MEPTKHDEAWGRPLQVASRRDNDTEVHAERVHPHPQPQAQSQQQDSDLIEQPRRLKRTRSDNAPPDHNNFESSTTESSVTSCVPALQQAQAPAQQPDLKPRHLSLDRGAIAPGLARPTAPFAKSQRKKAYVSAIYYSECFLRNIQPKDADSAAFDIQNQYKKWWVQTKKPTFKKSKETRVPATTTDNKNVLDTDHNDATTNIKRPRLEEPKPPSCLTLEQLTDLKERLIEHLHKTGGDTTTPEFQSSLEQLRAHSSSQKNSKEAKSAATLGNIDGTWLALSKPTFSECQGRNENGEYMYSLGRMSFDMFRPTGLKCSIRAVMNNVRLLNQDEVPENFSHRLGKVLNRRHHHRKSTATATSNPIENPIRHYE